MPNVKLLVHISTAAVPAIIHKNKLGDRARPTPIKVATPFPPLHFSQNGYKCPAMTQAAPLTMTHS